MPTRAEGAQALADALSAATGITAEQHPSEDVTRVEVTIPADTPLTSRQWSQLRFLLGALPLSDTYGNRRLQDGRVLLRADLRDGARSAAASRACEERGRS